MSRILLALSLVGIIKAVLGSNPAHTSPDSRMTATHSIVLIALVASASLVSAETSAADVLVSAYESCVRHGSFACVKPKVLAFLGEALGKDIVKITRDLSVVRTSNADVNDVEGELRAEIAAAYEAKDPEERRLAIRRLLLDGIDRYLQSHEIRVAMPEELVEVTKTAEKDGFAREIAQTLPTELRMPLEEPSQEVEEDETEVEARHKKKPFHHLFKKKKHRKGFLKQVVLPFLLGLKFKATALVPLALSLIALKTWKALTLGLLSLVLSGAMVIFRFTKPKVVNYEVFHYPQSGNHDHYDHHGYARDIAYSAYRP